MARALVLALLLVSCSAPAAAPAPTEDPRLAQLLFANAALQEQVTATKAEAEKARAAVTQAQCCATFVMWALPMTERAGNYAVIGMPDTFTVTIRFTTDHPVQAWVMDLSQLVAIVNGRPFTAAVTLGTVTSVDTVFHGSEGCAAYVLVILPSVDTVITPDVRITRHVSPPTGYCAP